MATRKQVVRSVVMSTDAWAGCLTHALSTESEEIMGVLFGEVVEEEQSPGKSTRANGTKSSANSVDCTVLVYSFKTLVRSDRRKDRVEVSSLQLSAALHSVEQDKKELLRSNMKIVGWYHSHPHITVLPSHVDLRSQLKYQELDSTWVGLIFSVFSSGSSTNASMSSSSAATGAAVPGAKSEMKTVAFQTTVVDGRQHEQRIIPVRVCTLSQMDLCFPRQDLSARNYERLVSFYSELFQEEIRNYNEASAAARSETQRTFIKVRLRKIKPPTANTTTQALDSGPTILRL
eukprot:INCI15767.1.p1 GENE.INCI15767.1~~INCI15767.1.p1  ORF type:complete len:289 (+),score=48.38 INCI15767.1:204-1070(+)